MNSERIYQGDDDQWYFSIRGNQAKGPFLSYLDAETALNRHVNHCRRRFDTPLWPKALSGLKLGRQKTEQPTHT